MRSLSKPSGGPTWSCCLALGVGLPLALVAGTAQSQGRGLSFSPGLTITQSFTDNLDLSSTNPRAEAITQIRPGVRVSAGGGRLRGSLNYSLDAQIYARDSERSDVGQNLAAAFTAELLEQSAFVDVRAGIARQSISAFGAPLPDPTLRSRNSTESRNLSISPVLRTRVGTTTLEARSSWVTSDSGQGQLADGQSLVHSLSASGQWATIGWGLQFSDATNKFDGGREAGSQALSASASFRPDVDWLLTGRIGRERDTVRSTEAQSTNTWGVGANWTPSGRTQVNAQYDKRYFGDGYGLNVSHRLRRAVIRLSDSRDAQGVGNDRLLNLANAYDELDRQLRTIEPDPARRDLLVRTLLAQQGNPLTRSVSLQRRQELSVALQGLRATLAFTAYRTRISALDNAGTVNDDLQFAGRVGQSGYSASASYRLSSVSSATLGWQRTQTDDAGFQAGGQQTSWSAGFTTQPIRRVSLSLSLRHVEYVSLSNPYTENGGQISLGFAF